MNINIKNNKNNDLNFLALFIIGVVTALRDDVITIDDAWNWILNIRILDYSKNRFGKSDITDVIHLGTELEDVKRIIPDKFKSACDDIILLCNKILQENIVICDKINYHLEIDNN